ncbi:flagellar biosynthesis protein FlhA (plasmid) [Leisingera sp. S132]|uniref:flagellar biosynthesis protein FlhA n=1 Tax=Leisingera sp. S132 TaxID=2867016 RepID=UPI0021A4DB41|nr:flagellar biosynthesis protein FlhA [Leisingera sp. S132]UWQ81707.1 flagellar biosynthesis protein FlhA [Leisingera sp. S132]
MKILNAIAGLGRQKDVMLIAVFALILMMMILPLPTVLMDIFITLNMSAAIIIMLMSLHLHSPVQFSTFPSLLLVTTLFRLAISISTTRLILIEGNAGKIVETFGTVVVGGNLVVGLVIFLIITVVQFLVITKGADRVAEVGARFTLDGMPGKQMSVDADVRAGNIDHVDARSARQTLEREAKLFGSMDGAMKFVKGDATAGLVITAINLLGGVAIGMAQRGLPFGEAIQLYALMTVGDGLVSQIPALLISVAAGTMVTRVTNPQGMDLGTEIGQQVMANRRTIIIAGLVIALFGLVPGFPTAIFAILGLSLSGSVYFGIRKYAKTLEAQWSDWDLMIQRLSLSWDDIKARTGADEAVKVVLPRKVTGMFNPEVFNNTLEGVRTTNEADFGVPMGYWRYSLSDELQEYQIFIKEELVASGRLDPDTVFVKANISYLSSLGIPSIARFGAQEGALVEVSEIPRLQEENIQYWGPLEQLLMHVKKAVIEHLGDFAGLQATSNLLDIVGRSNPNLVADLREDLSNNQISSVLRMLLKERIPVTSTVRILEAIAKASQTRSEPEKVLQKVRTSISEFITKRFAPEGYLPVIVTAPTLENFIREGMRETDEGSYLILAPEVSAHIAEQAKSYVSGEFRRGQDPALITQQDVRYPLYTILEKHGIYLPVLAYQEIHPDTIIYPVGFLSPEADAEAA